MYAIEMLGSYITKGVSNVVGPFHPFSGAVDIIVVEQPDGSFKSSPWYVQFGKFQGVLKARENVVTISINGMETNFHMILDQTGEAYFLRELEIREKSLSHSSLLGDRIDDRLQKSTSIKSRSDNHDSHIKIVNGTNIGRISLLDGAEVITNLTKTSSLDENQLEKKLTTICETSTIFDIPNPQDDASEVVNLQVKCSSLPLENMSKGCFEKNLNEKETLNEIGVTLPSLHDPQDVDQDDTIKVVSLEVMHSNSPIENMFEGCPKKNLHGKEMFNEIGVTLPSLHDPQDVNQDNTIKVISPELMCFGSPMENIFKGCLEKNLHGNETSNKIGVTLPSLDDSQNVDKDDAIKVVNLKITCSSSLKENMYEGCLEKKIHEKKDANKIGVAVSSLNDTYNIDQDDATKIASAKITSSNSPIENIVKRCVEKDLQEKDAFYKIDVALLDLPNPYDVNQDDLCEVISPKVTCFSSSMENMFEGCAKRNLHEKETSNKIDVTSLDLFNSQDVDQDDIIEVMSLKIMCPSSPTKDMSESCLEKNLHKKDASNKIDVVLLSLPNSQVINQDDAIEGVSLKVMHSSSSIDSMSKKYPEKNWHENEASNETDVVLPGLPTSQDVDGDYAIKVVSPEVMYFDLPMEECPKKNLHEKKAFNEIDVALPKAMYSGLRMEECPKNNLHEKETSNEIDIASLGNSHDVDQDDTIKVVSPKVICSNFMSHMKDKYEKCPKNNLHEKEAFNKNDVAFQSLIAFKEENKFQKVSSSLYEKISESLTTEFDGSKEPFEETLYNVNGEFDDVCFCAKTSHVTIEPIIKDTISKQAKDISLDRKRINTHDIYSQNTMSSTPSIYNHDEMNIEVPVTVSPFTQMLYVDPVPDLVETKPNVISSDSSFSNLIDQIKDKTGVGNEIVKNDFPPSPKLVGRSEAYNASSIPVLERSDEEQFFFDLDIPREAHVKLDLVCKDSHPSSCQRGVNVDDESSSSPYNLVQKNGLGDVVNMTEKSKLMSSPICIPKRHDAAGTEVERLIKSLPNMWSDIDNLNKENLNCSPSYSINLDSESLDWNKQHKNKSQVANSNIGSENLLVMVHSKGEDTHHQEDIKDGVNKPPISKGDPSKANATRNGSWSLWPFAFRRSRSRKTIQPTLNDTRSSDAGNTLECNVDVDNKEMDNKDMDSKDMDNGKVLKKMVKEVTPTSEELASLNMIEGSNEITFTFSTSMLGRQKVDARIFLWKWNTRIVISDVDGTITRSDVLGQFMPLVGIDWSQTGVTHLFSAIKENGYQFLYLSARAIAQAYITRQFLLNLKQDGKALPDGPVVISPDGLVPSLFREVVRRAPHEFKIACLEDIKALFPSDCNPFYAGFGNRDTDEISYLKVGIPKGKIFIINPKGDVSVNRLIDTRSYNSLHALVHGMFPVMTSSEQVVVDKDLMAENPPASLVLAAWANPLVTQEEFTENLHG